MKNLVSIFIIFFLILTACKKQSTEPQITELGKVDMKFIPANPTSNDLIKFVILDDCNYNILSLYNRKGTNIDIEKHFNSLMKWPCILTNDTILIGKLTPGTYTVNYKLLAIANPGSIKITASATYTLKVTL
jgi:hypothetical protein